MENKADVIVIGAGIVGLSTAYYLAKAGKSVTLIEKTDGSDSCSYGNAGFIAPSHFIPLASPGIVSKGLRWMLNPESPFYIKPRLNSSLISWGWNFLKSANQTHVNNTKQLLADLSIWSRELHLEFAEAENVDIQNKGILLHCTTEATMNHERELARMGADFGMETRIFDVDELNEEYPKVKHTGVGAVHFPIDSTMIPKDFMTNMTRAVEELGVNIVYNQEVTGFDTSNNIINKVRTPDSEYEGDEIVLATGSFTPTLTKLVGNRLLLEAGKGYSVDYYEESLVPDVSYILVEARVAITPMQKFVRIAGTMELGGINDTINPRRVAGFLKSVKDYLPEFEYEKMKSLPVWSGLRPCTPDGLPYVGRDSKYNNLIIAAGHAMVGFTLGPATGKLVSELVTGDDLTFNIDQLAVNRF